ncbi:50S ribosomal protein L11 methyltransferase [Altererythrobacter sp. GH1-8]|uniref:50S ribosomal protein L11 methyltransferase n=1 Tax=Altererythrobacter sp. GH1-8 TaxID=3349333 RepID=UPI00374D5379
MTSWKLIAFAPKPVVQAALLAHEMAEELGQWDAGIVLAGREVAEDRPQDWVLEAWMERRPGTPERKAVKALFEGVPPAIKAEQLPDEDWLTLSQHGAEPIFAGRFHVRTPEYAPRSDLTDLVIPASQAFGTGQHATTAGCLEMLDAMKRSGVAARNIADIGTGTGLLAFAARELWPNALQTASDIDEVCADVVAENAAMNNVPIGAGRGEVTMIIAPGTDHPLIEARGPYDLLIANILAGPLVELAPDFERAVTPGGNLLLAGLLETQEPRIRRAYRTQGFRLAARLVNGDWSILWLRKRRS